MVVFVQCLQIVIEVSGFIDVSAKLKTQAAIIFKRALKGEFSIICKYVSGHLKTL